MATKEHDQKQWQWIVNGRQAQIIMDALTHTSASKSDAPHREIEEICQKLERMEAAKRSR